MQELYHPGIDILSFDPEIIMILMEFLKFEILKKRIYVFSSKAFKASPVVLTTSMSFIDAE